MSDFSNLKARIEADIGRLVRRAITQEDEIRAVQACLSLAFRSACHYHDSAENLLDTARRLGGHGNAKATHDWVKMFPSNSRSYKLLVKSSPSCKKHLERTAYDQRVHNTFMYAMMGLPPGILPKFYEKWLFGPVYNESATYQVMVNHIGPCLCRVLVEMRKRFMRKGYSKLAANWHQFIDFHNEDWKQLVSRFFVPVSPSREEEILSVVTPRESAPRKATLVVPGAQQAQLFVGEGEVQTVIGPLGAPVMITPTGAYNRVELDLITRSRSGQRFYISSPAAVIPVSELYSVAVAAGQSNSSTSTVQGSGGGNVAEELGAVAVLLGDGHEQLARRPEHLHPEPERNRALMSVQVEEAHRQLAKGEAEIWRAAHARVKERRATTMREVCRLQGLVAHLDGGDIDPNNHLTHGRYGPSLTYIHPTSYHPLGQSTETIWRRGGNRSGVGANFVGHQMAQGTEQCLNAVSEVLRERAARVREQEQARGERGTGVRLITNEASAATPTTAPASPVQLPASYEDRAVRVSPNPFSLMHAAAAEHERIAQTGGGAAAGAGGKQAVRAGTPTAACGGPRADDEGLPSALSSFPTSPIQGSPMIGSAFLTDTDIDPGVLLTPFGVECVMGPHTRGRDGWSKCVGPWSAHTKQGACVKCVVAALEQAENGGDIFGQGFKSLTDEEHEKFEELAMNDREMKLLEAERAVKAIGEVMLQQEELALRLQLLAEAKAPPTAYLARALDLQVELVQALTAYAADAVQGNELEKHEMVPRGLNDRKLKFKWTLQQLLDNDSTSRHPFNEEGTGGQLVCVEGSSAAPVQYAGTTREPVVLTHSPPSSPSDSPSDSDEVQEPEPKRQKLRAAADVDWE